MIDWKKYPNFTEAEFKCREFGTCLMQEPFILLLQTIRDKFDKPMIITSGFRSPEHSRERNKPTRGEHTTGLCADIGIHGLDAMELLGIALELKVSRIGINQKGDLKDRFIHLGIGDKFYTHLIPGIWTY